MKQILIDIVNFFSNIRSSVGSFFGNIEIYIIAAIILYIIAIILLIVWLKYSRKTFDVVNSLFNKDMDDLYYQVSLILYNNKEDIHEFKKNIPLLLQYKTQEISKKNKANYINNYKKLIDEIDYIGELTNNPITYNRQQLDSQYSIAHNLSQNTIYMQNTLSVVTLGVSNLFL